MKKYAYRLLDVFTHAPFGGNPLAVFTDARGLTDAYMQNIARELNLSETTFVLPPRDPSHHYWVRIFTPLVELPTAGHPTIGTAYALAMEARLRQEAARQRVVFEEGSGPVSVTIEAPMITMQQRLPEFGPHFDQRDAMAAMLGLERSNLSANLPVQAVSCGVPYLIVPVRDLASMQSIQLRMDIWDRMLKRSSHPHIYAFCMGAESATSSVHARMFAPGLGLYEDAATGSAAGPLGAYLVQHRLVERKPRVSFIAEQGIEMGRPSFIHIFVEVADDRITAIRVGGQCFAIGQGEITIDG